MPKQKPIPDSDDDEKTTIESQWEEEASTTVEQGDVADKIRSLTGAPPRNNQTGGTGTGADEPTVDDQNAPMSAITPVRDNARLVITQGNDTGQETEIRPGKTYTIGRSIDNDVVLTDISVSRKHFDLRFEDGMWVIIDRGSGNGTVVNGNLEDSPFMLANGDMIEIGNTLFRFDQPHGASRSRPQVFDPDDDEEMSTVAGKPLRAEIIELVEEKPPPPVLRPQRPKTLPPPTPRGSSHERPVVPLRPSHASVPPPLSLPPQQPASTLPMPQMANRPPLGSPQMPTMLGDPQMGMPPPGMMPTTIPGQGPPRPMYGYPQASEIPPHSVHAQMLLLQTANRRDPSGGMAPIPFDGMQMHAPRGYGQPQISKRAKLVLAAIGLAVFAAVATIAIIKSSSEKPKPAAAAGSNEKLKSEPKGKVATTTVVPIKESPPPVVPPPKQEPTIPPVEPTKQEPAQPAPPQQTVDMTKQEPPKPAPVKTVVAPPPPPPPPPKQEVKVIPIKKEVKTAAKTASSTPKREKKKDPPPPKPEVKVVEEEEEDEDAPAAPAPSTSGKEEARADSLYRDKKFAEAAKLLYAAASKASGARAKSLRNTADLYANLGKEYYNGMASGSAAKDAFEALRRASNFDRNLANAFDADIQTKLAQVAPKAAATYMAKGNYSGARDAVIVAEKFGASEGVKLVRQKLESVASEIYAAASKELEENPSSASAKDKLRQIKSMVDQKSTWYQKADKLLKGG